MQRLIHPYYPRACRRVCASVLCEMKEDESLQYRKTCVVSRQSSEVSQSGRGSTCEMSCNGVLSNAACWSLRKDDMVAVVSVCVGEDMVG